MTTYGVKVNRVNFTIAVVYLVPDADTAAVTAVYRKLIESENKYENFMAMGDFNLDFKTDSVKKILRNTWVYLIKEYYLDPTRRPPMKPEVLQKCLDELKEIFRVNQDRLIGSCQSEILEFIRWQTRETLDKHNPLNKSGLHRKKIFRVPMSEKTRGLIQDFYTAKRNLHIAERKNLPPDVLIARKRAFIAARRAKKHQVRKETREYRRGKLEAQVEGGCNPWEIIKRCFPDKRPALPSEPLEIKGKTGVDLADHMAEYFYKRAKLMSDEDIEEHYVYVPLPKSDFSELPPIEFDPVGDLDIPKMFNRKSKPTLATGPDTLSHRHVMDLMPVLEAAVPYD